MSLALLKLISPSPLASPSIPSLAELQAQARTLSSALPAYTSSEPLPASKVIDESIKSKPIRIPQTILSPHSNNPSSDQTDKSWLSGVGLGSWTSNDPPPSYKVQDSTMIPLTHRQLREENLKDRAGDRSVPGRDMGDVDQAREGLRGMRERGWDFVQSMIPGEGPTPVERVGKKDRWGRKLELKSESRYWGIFVY